MKTHKQMKKESLAYKLVEIMAVNYTCDLFDYSGCYYEGDRPDLNLDVLRDRLAVALKELGIV